MRRTVALLTFAVWVALFGGPALALDRVPLPIDDSGVVRVADLDRPLQRNALGRADSYWYWRYRAAYTRWMHNEYAHAGYPVRHRQFRTYARTYACCRGYRHR